MSGRLMSGEEARIICSIDDLQWVALARVVRGCQDNAALALRQVANSREQDLYYKGGISAFEEVIELRNTAHSIQHARDDQNAEED